MKSAEEYAIQIGRPISCMSKCNRKCGVVCQDAIDLANAIKADAIKACAEKCAADRTDRDFVPKSFWAKLEAEQRTRILSLLPKD